MYFWAGVSAIAGALRRKVWIDQAYFRWYPNFYVILVAPPGIVSKSTTASVAMNLLRRVPGIKFGPDVVTWQALVTSFAEAAETFLLDGSHYTMSPITIESSEFGNLLNPADKDMVDLLVSLWDGKQGAFVKKTKNSGNDSVENPWINLIACTTPSWIAGNFPEYMIGGGFTSRCVFIYAEEKEKYVAYPGLVVPENLKEREQKLVEDLEHIAINIQGSYVLTPQAVAWGEQWYRHHYTNRPVQLDDDRFGGYIARKQTHIHKLAMVLSASQRDERIIEEEDLHTANNMVTALEADMPLVFSKIGQVDAAVGAERLMQYVRRRGGCRAHEAQQHVWSCFPNQREYMEVLSGLVMSRMIRQVQMADGFWLFPVNDPAAPAASGATPLEEYPSLIQGKEGGSP